MITFLRTANFLATVSGAVHGRIGERVKQHPNQTESSLAALNVIGLYEGCTNSALSRAIGLSHTATVRLVDKLEAQGLVISRQGQVDKRSVEFALTDEGKAYTKELLMERCLAAGSILELLEPDEQEQLSAILAKLLSRLGGRPNNEGDLCRLCDQTACPPENCPVHTSAMHPQE